MAQSELEGGIEEQLKYNVQIRLKTFFEKQYLRYWLQSLQDDEHAI